MSSWEWLQKTFGLSAETHDKLITSLAVVMVTAVLRWLILTLVYRRTEDFRARYHWRKTSGYLAFFFAILLLGRVWFVEFQSVSTFLGLLSAGLAIALRDILVDIVGWAFILWRRPFEVGDRIQIGSHSGDVIDIRIFQFTLMEIGNWVHADQSTGRIIHVPNGKVFTEPQVNYTKGWFEFIWNEVAVTITFESNWKAAKEMLMEIARRHAGHLSAKAGAHLKKASHKFMIFSPSLDPVVYTSVESNGVLLTLRYLCEPRKRRDSTQEVWEEILAAFGERKDIDFAYPTQRFYNNVLEGKEKTRPQPGQERERMKV